MAFTRSCFNGTLYRKNLQRFWPLLLAFAAAWGLLVCMPLASTLENDTRVAFYNGVLAQDAMLHLTALMTDTIPLLSLAMGTIAAVAVFGYLFSSRTASAYHALPLRRECLFGTAVVSGLTLLAIPAVLALAAIMAIEASYGILTPAAMETITAVAAVMGGALLIFFAMAVLAAHVAGSAPGMLALTAVENLLAVFLDCIIKALTFPYLYGFVMDNVSRPAAWLSPIYQMLTGLTFHYDYSGDVATVSSFSGLGLYGIYAIAAVAVLAVALLLYRRRPVESAGNVLAFPVLRSVFAVGAGVCLALLMTYVVRQGYSSAERMSLAAVLALLALWSFVGWFAALMIVHKRFRVFTRRTVAGWAVLAVLLCGGLTGAYYDVLGLADCIPALDRIDSAQVTIGGVTDEDPATVRVLHQLILDDHKNGDDQTDATDSAMVVISYTVGSRQIDRLYTLWLHGDQADDAGTLEAAVLDYFSDGERMAEVILRDATADNVVSGTVTHWEQWYQAEEVQEDDGSVGSSEALVHERSMEADLDRDQCSALLAAIRADLDAGHNRYVDDLLGNDGTDDSGYDESWWLDFAYRGDSGDTDELSVRITPSMTETLDAIVALGVTDQMQVSHEYGYGT